MVVAVMLRLRMMAMMTCAKHSNGEPKTRRFRFRSVFGAPPPSPPPGLVCTGSSPRGPIGLRELTA
eukprot:10272770-Alexandrium_andersonii.AAC.1